MRVLLGFMASCVSIRFYVCARKLWPQDHHQHGCIRAFRPGVLYNCVCACNVVNSAKPSESPSKFAYDGNNKSSVLSRCACVEMVFANIVYVCVMFVCRRLRDFLHHPLSGLLAGRPRFRRTLATLLAAAAAADGALRTMLCNYVRACVRLRATENFRMTAQREELEAELPFKSKLYSAIKWCCMVAAGRNVADCAPFCARARALLHLTFEISRNARFAF